MTLPVLQCRFIYGLRTEISGNAHYINEDEILYPVGNVLTLHNFNQNHQRIIKLGDKSQTINIICVSPNKKITALCEKGDKPVITLYDMTTLKRKKILNLPFSSNLGNTQDQGSKITAKEIITCSFTIDNKYFLVVTGQPDWLLITYNWEKGKIENISKAIYPNNTGTICQISCNPIDPSVIVLVGIYLFRLMAYSESVWRQWGFSKADNWFLTSASWISLDQILCGSNDGKIHLIESGEYKITFNAFWCDIMDFRPKDEKTEEEKELDSEKTKNYGKAFFSDKNTYTVTNIISFIKGFAFACGLGIVHVFEKLSNTKFKRRNIFVIPDLEFETIDFHNLSKINFLNINFMQDKLIATTPRNQIYVVKLWGPDISQILIHFQPLGPRLHHGPIQTVALCAWKPLIMTNGKLDRSIRMWNYLTAELLMIKQYQQDLNGLAIHPTGHFCAIGFNDKLRYFLVNIDDFSLWHEFSIRSCNLCSFSSQGHLFAAVNTNIIQIYSTVSFENIFNLKGHMQKITSLSWTAYDFKLASCGSEGVIYEWDLSSPEPKRSGEIIIKTNSFKDCAITSDGKLVFSVGSDGCIKQTCEYNVLRNVKLTDGELNSLALSRSDKMLFVSGPNGIIYSISLPISDGIIPEYNHYKIHYENCSKIKLTYDDKYLISVSVDGSMCIWKLIFIEGKSIKLNKDFKFTNQVFIDYDDLFGKINLINELKLRLEELENEHLYQVQQMQLTHSEEVQKLQQNYLEQINKLKEIIDQLEQDHTMELTNMNAEINKLNLNHEREINELESKYNQKLIYEYNKYNNLENKLNEIKRSYEKQIIDINLKKDKEIKETNELFKKIIDKKQEEINKLFEDIKLKEKEHEIIKQQIEDDVDREIVELKITYETKLKEIEENLIQQKAITMLMKKKAKSAQKESDDQKHKVDLLKENSTKLKNQIQNFEKDIDELKKNINQRDQTLQEKEKILIDLKEKMQNLEKFNVVLNHQVTELKSQIEPKDKEIYQQKHQIEDMVLELEMQNRKIINMELLIKELKIKLLSFETEVEHEKNKQRRCQSFVRQLQTEIHDTSGLIQQPHRLKTAITRMYHQYSEQKDFEEFKEEECLAKNEFLRQRDHLESTVHQLKHSIERITKMQENEKSKLIENKKKLIDEIKNLKQNHTKESHIQTDQK